MKTTYGLGRVAEVGPISIVSNTSFWVNFDSFHLTNISHLALHVQTLTYFEGVGGGLYM